MATQRPATAPFTGGYLVARERGHLSPEVADWPVRTLAGHDYHLGPRTVLTSSLAPGGGVIALLGQPVDVASGTAEPQAITDRLAALLGAGVSSVLRGTLDLGGRWTLLVHEESGGLSVLTDALASQAVWWDPQGSVIASHAVLAPGASVLPADQLLEVSKGGAAARPHSLDDAAGLAQAATEAPSTDPGVMLALIRERLGAHTALLAGLGRPAVALTAGPASAAVLAAYLPHHRQGGFAFTYFAPEWASEGGQGAQDMFAASRLAQQVGLEHRVLRAQEPSKDHPLARALRATFPEATSLAGAVARHGLPPEVVELHSAGAEAAEASTPPDTSSPGGSSAGIAVSDYRLGDPSHRVLLPFNDRRLLALMRAVPPPLREAGALLRALNSGVRERD